MGPGLKVGINPVSDSDTSLFLTEGRPTNDHVPPETHVAVLKDLLMRFPSPTIQGIASRFYGQVSMGQDLARY
jgi:hypothetical protein